MDQKTALALLKSGKNVFLTGSAGSGKTYVLNQYITYLKERKVPVGVTASTGIAATHMNGMTIHAWSGIGVRESLSNRDLVQMKGKKYLSDHLSKVKILVVDEVSMLHKNQLDLVDQVLRFFKGKEEAFGGIQVVLCGDFFQLPPVGQQAESSRDKFAFMSKAWLAANLSICYLTEQHRQADNVLNQILNDIRTSSVTVETINRLKAAENNELASDLEPTRLYTHNRDVDRINYEFLEALEGEKKLFTASTKGNQKLIESLKNSVLTEEALELKIGAKVMFVKNNYEKGYVNGTLGQVKDYTSEGLPVIKTMEGKSIVAEQESWSVQEDSGKSLASFNQIPVRLAWAITVHKSQGMTLDAAEIDLSKTFERGQGYVALSRLKDLDGLKLIGLNGTALEVDPLASKADKRFRELSDQAAELHDPNSEESAWYAFMRKCGGLTDFKEIEKAKKKKKFKLRKKSTYQITREFLEQGLSLKEIADERGMAESTLAGHLIKLSELLPDFDLSPYKPPDDMVESVQKAYTKLADNPRNFREDGTISQKVLYDTLNGKIGYQEIRLCLAFVKK